MAGLEPHTGLFAAVVDDGLHGVVFGEIASDGAPEVDVGLADGAVVADLDGGEDVDDFVAVHFSNSNRAAGWFLRACVSASGRWWIGGGGGRYGCRLRGVSNSGRRRGSSTFGLWRRAGHASGRGTCRVRRFG